VFASVEVGDVIKVTATDLLEGAQGAFRELTAGWPAIGDGYEYFDISGDFEMPVTGDILTKLQTNGLVVGGQNYTISKVELIK
ncbi:MAG: hypothetical protein LBH30_03665, partial [Prevotellaceae bacterium]|nr:hypothetical protein [Prevotellaceae bacterium]